MYYRFFLYLQPQRSCRNVKVFKKSYSLKTITKYKKNDSTLKFKTKKQETKNWTPYSVYNIFFVVVD